MLSIAVLDSDAFCCKGIADYFDARDIRTFHCPDLPDLEKTLQTKMVEVVIAELATSRDTLFDCVAFLTKVSRRWPRVRLIIYSHITDPVVMNYVLRHVTHCNIVLKNDSIKQLAACVFSSASGHSFYSSSQAKVWKYLPDDRKTLTPREFSLLEMLACGQDNNLIARNISRSNKTVSNHRQNIMKKLGCRNLAELHGKLYELDMLKIQ